MAKAILFINLKKDSAPLLASEIKPELEKRGLEVDSFSFDREPVFEPRSKYDIAFSLGGDGTVLYTARSMAPLGVPVFPVNLGTVGFIAGIHPENWKPIFDEWYSHRRAGPETSADETDSHTPLLGSSGARISRRLMLETSVERKGRVVARNICLNEAVISSPGVVKLLRLDVSLGESYHGEEKNFLHLGQYRSDGLIAATPTGSTAYSAAAGGPILDPELEAFILNPICPFTLSHRPLVFPAGETVLIEVEKEQKGGALLSADGQVNEPLEGGDKIYVSRAPYKAVLIASGRTVFYEALKTKFSWLRTVSPASMPTAGESRTCSGDSGNGALHA